MVRRLTKEIVGQVITYTVGKWNPSAKHDLHAAKAASVLLIVPRSYWTAAFRISMMPTRIVMETVEFLTYGSRYMPGTFQASANWGVRLARAGISLSRVGLVGAAGVAAGAAAAKFVDDPTLVASPSTARPGRLSLTSRYERVLTHRSLS